MKKNNYSNGNGISEYCRKKMMDMGMEHRGYMKNRVVVCIRFVETECSSRYVRWNACMHKICKKEKNKVRVSKVFEKFG